MSVYTYNYDQPAEYRFSLDSIEMPFKVAEYLRQQGKNLAGCRVLDLCSGCGVVGFEFHFHQPQIARLDFVEVQDVYKPFFESNLLKINQGPRADSSTQFEYFAKNYSQMPASQLADQYDLILCNPPYFEADQGKLSPSEFKNRCRFFLDSDLPTLIETMLCVLKPGGLSFFLLRSLSEHKKDSIEIVKKIVLDRGDLQVLDLVRGTSLLKLQKYTS